MFCHYVFALTSEVNNFPENFCMLFNFSSDYTEFSSIIKVNETIFDLISVSLISYYTQQQEMKDIIDHWVVIKDKYWHYEELQDMQKTQPFKSLLLVYNKGKE